MNLPQVFGRYLLVQRLSRGGMGEIFLAKHGLAGFEKLAVIKKVLPHLAADASFISRFVDEAQVAIKLQHVNVAQVFEVGRVGDEYFLALEYVEGRDLRRTLARLGHEKRRFPVDLALFIGRELANGLAYAHRRTALDGSSLNLVHCDISPPNVLVSFEGETKVIDFGIAKSAMRGTATDPKMGFGKFGYMAPEQLIRGGIVDHRTDIYAAGVVLYEVLTGQRLYEPGPEPDYRMLAKKVSRGEHPLPSQLDPVLAPYDQLVSIALRAKQDERYQTAAEFRDSIQQALVGVNPTISTDQLGSYMRDLFADEMTAQKDLHERIAKARVEDFEVELHDQTISTVSFAVNGVTQLPGSALPPVAAAQPVGPPVQPARHGTLPPPLPGQGPSPAALPSVSPSTSFADQLDLADGTGTSVREAFEPPRKRTALWLLLIAFVVAAGVVTIILATRTKEPVVVATGSGDTGSAKITFEPIVDKKIEKVETQPVVVPIDAAVEITPDAEAPVAIPTPPITHKRDKHKKEPKETAEAAKPGLTRAEVGQKFQATSRLYEAFKQKNGMSLDAEWNELTHFLQNKMTESNLDEAAHKIDVFRAKLKD
ncbi:MAG TPA: serine/threonine-protein kinase [Kofleriaceae bacterium]|jgi:serine/threonine protein kinase